MKPRCVIDNGEVRAQLKERGQVSAAECHIPRPLREGYLPIRLYARCEVTPTPNSAFDISPGTFVSLYKFLLNAIPLYIPAVNPPDLRYDSWEAATFEEEDSAHDKLEAGELPRGMRRTARRDQRLSLSAHAQLVLTRKKTRRWHAAMAGAIAGGLAIMCENKNRRNVIAQQLFVRGLQGSYNSVSERTGFRIPHGEVILFSLS